MRYLILMCLLARSFSSKTSTLLHSFRSRSFLTKSLLPAGPKAYSAVLSAYRCQLRPVCLSRMVGRKREWFLPRSPGCGRWSAVAGRSSRPRGSNPQCSDACGRSPSGRKMVRQRILSRWAKKPLPGCRAERPGISQERFRVRRGGRNHIES